MSAPRISVIIPVFNDNGVLAECLASLKKQTIQDFEVIIVDDGSTKAVPNASLRFDKNRGAPAARNAGFNLSKGEFVIFLDHDAVLVPEALEAMLKALEAHPEADFAYPSFYFGRTLFSAKPFDEAALREAPYIHTSALIRRSAFPGFDEQLKKFQDWDLFLTMSEAGSRGVAIDRVLFSLRDRGTMSQWIPAFVFQLPWRKLGRMPKSVKKYLEADRIIRQKHGLPEAKAKLAETHWFWLCLILLTELLSFSAAFHPAFSLGVTVVAGLAMLVVSWFRPDIASGAILTEFMIGSLGHLFSSFRIVLVAAFMLGWLAKSWRELKWSLHPSYYFLAASVLLGVLLGYWHGWKDVWADANGWFAFVLLFPVLDLARKDGKGLKRILQPAAETALCWLALESLGLFYLFSHDFGSWTETVYLWIRRTGVGELTLITKAASATRIFLQSQIYSVLAAVGLIGAGLRSRKQMVLYVISIATILVSFSRSFWIGCAAACFFLAITILRRKNWSLIPRLIVGGIVGALIPVVIFLFPFPASHGNLLDVFFARADAGESAAQSRWELLPVLNAKIAEAPLFGSGFGATVTYQSKDPRIVASTGGTDTTYAFEWGWHDISVKLGLVGVFLYVWLLVTLFGRLGKAGKTGWQAALLALAVTHIFTPYLGHPLGILFIILAEASLVA